MKHPWHYRGLKRTVGFFLLRHSLLTARQWRGVLLSTSETPQTHEQFTAKYGLSEPTCKQTRRQLEDAILRSPTWREPCPTLEASTAAIALAAAGELSSAESRLGATRDMATRFLRRRLTPLEMATVEVVLSDYDASAPHPRYVFGRGWSEHDQLVQARATAELTSSEGIETEEEWLARRGARWNLRLVDRLLYWRQFAFALSIPRWYRELRYRVQPRSLVTQ